MTDHWVIRLFTFVLVIMDVNISLVLRFSVYITRNVNNLSMYAKFHCNFPWLLTDNHDFSHKKKNSNDLFFDNTVHKNIQMAPSYTLAYRNRAWAIGTNAMTSSG